MIECLRENVKVWSSFTNIFNERRDKSLSKNTRNVHLCERKKEILFFAKIKFKANIFRIVVVTDHGNVSHVACVRNKPSFLHSLTSPILPEVCYITAKDYHRECSFGGVTRENANNNATILVIKVRRIIRGAFFRKLRSLQISYSVTRDVCSVESSFGSFT